MLPTPKPLGFYSFLCKYRYAKGAGFSGIVSLSTLEQCCSNGAPLFPLEACKRAQMYRRSACLHIITGSIENAFSSLALDTEHPGRKQVSPLPAEIT